MRSERSANEALAAALQAPTWSRPVLRPRPRIQQPSGRRFGVFVLALVLAVVEFFRNT